MPTFQKIVTVNRIAKKRALLQMLSLFLKSASKLKHQVETKRRIKSHNSTSSGYSLVLFELNHNNKVIDACKWVYVCVKCILNIFTANHMFYAHHPLAPFTIYLWRCITHFAVKPVSHLNWYAQKNCIPINCNVKRMMCKHQKKTNNQFFFSSIS